MVDKKVTAVSAQKRNPNRVNVFLDGEYGFSLSRIVAAWIEPGRMLDQNKINELIDQDLDETIFQSALRFLGYRPRSEKEIKTKLQQKGFPDEKIDSVIRKMRDSNMIRDDQFAISWVESRNEFHPRSQRLIRYELRNKGIKEEVITEVLQHSTNDQQMAEKAAEKMKNRYAGLDWQNFRNKFSAYLARKGFTYDVISTTVKRTWDELQSEKNYGKNEDPGE